MTFVSTSNDNSPYYLLNIYYTRYKQWDYQNDLRCAGVSNVKSSTTADGDISTNQTTNDTSNIISTALVQLTIASSEQRTSFENIAKTRSSFES